MAYLTWHLAASYTLQLVVLRSQSAASTVSKLHHTELLLFPLGKSGARARPKRSIPSHSHQCQTCLAQPIPWIRLFMCHT
jgi:hypothetical protein